MRLLTSKQIRKIEHKGYARGINVGYDIGYKTGWAGRIKREEVNAVVMAEIDNLMRGER